MISIGTYQQAHSQQFEKYEMQMMQDIASGPAKEDVGPGLGLGLAFASAWPFVAVAQCILILIYYAGITAIRKLRTRPSHKLLNIFISLVFIGICSFVSFSYLCSSLENFEWSFILRGIGEVITALGFALGAFGIIREMPNTRTPPLPPVGGQPYSRYTERKNDKNLFAH